MTTGKGKFSFEVPKGKYTISFEFLSFKTIAIENVDINANMDLGEIFMEEDAEALDEVTSDRRKKYYGGKTGQKDL